MSEAKKPVGLRLTNKLWVVLKQHGIEHHPSDKGQEGFDVTQTIESLLCQALGISLETSTPLSNAVSDDRLTEMISQQLNKLLSPLLYSVIDDNQTDVSKLLNSQITGIVDVKINEVITKLETGTNEKLASLEAEVVEIKKSLRDRELEVAAIVPTPPPFVSPIHIPLIDNPNIPTPVTTPKPTIKPTTGRGSEQMTYGAFFKKIGLTNPGLRNVSNANMAADRAKELGMTGWEYDSVNFKFYRES